MLQSCLGWRFCGQKAPFTKVAFSASAPPQAALSHALSPLFFPTLPFSLLDGPVREGSILARSMHKPRPRLT